MKKPAPIHPGEILLEEFLKPLGLSQYRLSKDIGVPARRINEIVLGKRSLTADTALRLSTYFQNSPQFWMNLQSQYDLEVEKDRLGERLTEEVVAHAPRAAVAAISLSDLNRRRRLQNLSERFGVSDDFMSLEELRDLREEVSGAADLSADRGRELPNSSDSS